MGARYDIQVLRREIDVLRGVIASMALTPVAPAPAWAQPLSRQQAALVGILLGAHPNVLDRYDIELALPGNDHAADRDPRIVNVLISGIRKRLGSGVIENVWGRGYRLSDPFAARIKAGEAGLEP